MGPIRLPFNGTSTGFRHPRPASLPDPSTLPDTADLMRTAGYKEVFLPQAGGIQTDTVLYVGVSFNVPLGGGSLTLLVPTLDGNLTYKVFERDGVSKAVAVPLTERGMWMFHIDPFLKGDILIGSSL